MHLNIFLLCKLLFQTQEDAKISAEKKAKHKKELELAKLGELHRRGLDLQAEQVKHQSIEYHHY